MSVGPKKLLKALGKRASPKGAQEPYEDAVKVHIASLDFPAQLRWKNGPTRGAVVKKGESISRRVDIIHSEDES